MLVCFKLRVVLHNCQKLLQGVHKLVLVRGLLVGSSLAGQALCPQGSNTLEDFLFMGRVPFDRSDQIGNQVVPPLQLRVDIAPSIANVVAQEPQAYCRLALHK